MQIASIQRILLIKLEREIHFELITIVRRVASIITTLISLLSSRHSSIARCSDEI